MMEIIFEVADEIIPVKTQEITPKQINSALKCLVDNGFDEYEAVTVLQALGYILLDTELFPE